MWLLKWPIQLLFRYEKVRKTHPILDPSTLESVIQALSLTSKWKLCLDLLEESKITAKPGGYSCNTVIAAAFRNNEDEVAWKLLDELIGQYNTIGNEKYLKEPQNTKFWFVHLPQWSFVVFVVANEKDIYPIVYTTYFKKIAKNPDKKAQVEKMFTFMQKNSIKVDSNHVEDFVKSLKCLNLTACSSVIAQR